MGIVGFVAQKAAESTVKAVVKSSMNRAEKVIETSINLPARVTISSSKSLLGKRQFSAKDSTGQQLFWAKEVVSGPEEVIVSMGEKNKPAQAEIRYGLDEYYSWSITLDGLAEPVRAKATEATIRPFNWRIAPAKKLGLLAKGYNITDGKSIIIEVRSHNGTINVAANAESRLYVAVAIAIGLFGE